MIKETITCHSPALTPSSQYRTAVVSKAYKNHKQQGFVSGDKRKATNLWVFGIELARL
jgi:hypothetical protein